MDIMKCALQHFVGDFARLLHAVHNFYEKVQYDTPVPDQISSPVLYQLS